MIKLTLLIFGIFFEGYTNSYLNVALNDSLTFEVEESGSVTAKITIDPKNYITRDSLFIGDVSQLIIVALPFESKSSWEIKNAPDVHIAIMTNGPDYTFLSIIFPKALDILNIEIKEAIQLEETNEGKSKLEFDPYYSFLSLNDKFLLGLPITCSEWKTSIVFPKAFDNTEISFNPLSITKIDNFTYSFPIVDRQIESSSYWIVFPNQVQRNLDFAKLFLSTIIGLFTLAFHWPAIRKQHLKWIISTFLLSTIVLVLTFYFTLNLANRMEFLVFAGISMPHAFFGFVASIYLLIAKKKQAVISGYIHIDNKAATFAEVTLVRVNNGKETIVNQTDNLQHGQYDFFIWPSKEPEQYRVLARAKNTEEASSQFLTVEKGDKIDIPLIELKRQDISQISDAMES